MAYKELGSIKTGLPKVTELFLPALLHLSMAKDDSSMPLWCLPHELDSQHLSDILISEMTLADGSMTRVVLS